MAKPKFLSSEVGGVHLNRVFLVLGNIQQSKDSIGHRTHRHARTAIDALYRIDVELRHVGFTWSAQMRMNAIYRARIDTRSVFDTGIEDYVGHMMIITELQSGQQSG